MAEFFQSGNAIDFVLAFIVIELSVLTILRARTGRGPSYLDLILMLSAGAALLAAWRASIAGAPWAVVAAFLLLSFVAHAADLRRRWKS